MSSIVKVIQPSGVLDRLQAEKICQEITEAISTDIRLFLIDLQNITFMDSAGLGSLAKAFKLVRGAGGELCLCSLREQPRILFELTGVEQIFKVFVNRDEFKEAFALASDVLNSSQE